MTDNVGLTVRYATTFVDLLCSGVCQNVLGQLKIWQNRHDMWRCAQLGGTLKSTTKLIPTPDGSPCNAASGGSKHALATTAIIHDSHDSGALLGAAHPSPADPPPAAAAAPEVWRPHFP